MMEFNQMPEKIIPLHFLVKYDPPLLGLLYKRHEKDKKKRAYYIIFNDMINLPNSFVITQQIFHEHFGFFNEDNVEFSQVQLIVEKILNAKDEMKKLQQSQSEVSYEGEEIQIGMRNNPQFFQQNQNKFISIDDEGNENDDLNKNIDEIQNMGDEDLYELYQSSENQKEKNAEQKDYFFIKDQQNKNDDLIIYDLEEQDNKNIQDKGPTQTGKGKLKLLRELQKTRDLNQF